MVDRVIEIPLPGRMLRAATADANENAPRFAVPAFVAGPENDVVASAVESLLSANDDAPQQRTVLILAIFGTTGTGKTHLARGLVHSWQEQFGAECAEYLTATDFRHGLREAINTSTVKDLRNRLRSRRLLAIDDLDRLPNDEYLQQELRATLDALAENGGTLVVTSSAAVGALRNLSVDVRSRLMAGLTLRLAPPEDAARERLIRHVSAALGRPLSDQAANRLAASLNGTANDVFGALFDLNADPAPPRCNFDADVDRYIASRAARRPSLAAILRTVGKHFGVPKKVLQSSSRRQSAVFARAMVVYLARELVGTSYERIGRSLGDRDHTTMLHNYRKIADRIGHDAATREAVDQMRSTLLYERGERVETVSGTGSATTRSNDNR